MKIGVTGCTGRVGSLITKELLSGDWKELELAGGTVLNEDEIADNFFMTTNAEELFTRADAVIDFTSPKAVSTHTQLAAKYKTILVIGTSGLSEADETLIMQASQKAPIVYAANMSIGVNLLIALVQQAARRLDESWDAEILDLHHKYKVDAPSGTSYALAKAVQKGRDKAFDKSDLTLAREGHTGPRKTGTIGFSVQRGGDVVAENSTIFFGMGERLEITHKATDRAIFARGALRAALWAKDQPAGLYSMNDVLGL
ncbi:MAG: 4-hydroxy-tetrahydrodipicolinate reductase [Alphaproteobacteria bacterium]|nr:4-hydroxy-tetrahydrodipicolinate reductase [Alphaproteobacteria bacterium]